MTFYVGTGIDPAGFYPKGRVVELDMEKIEILLAEGYVVEGEPEPHPFPIVSVSSNPSSGASSRRSG